MNGEKRGAWVTTRTLVPVKAAVQAEARRRHRSESEVVHLMLCSRYGMDPLTGEVTSGVGEPDAAKA